MLIFIKRSKDYKHYTLSDGNNQFNYTAEQVRQYLRVGNSVLGLSLRGNNAIMLTDVLNTAIKDKNIHLFDTFTGARLANHVRSELNGITSARNFAIRVYNYLNTNKDSRIVGIAGLRGTGKTVGLLQCIKKLGCYNDIVLINITVSMSNTIDCAFLYDFIRTYCKDKYVFIDEATYIKGLITDSAFFADCLKSEIRHLVFCGTDSLALHKCQWAALLHRICIFNTTFVSYTEAKRTVNMTFNEYLHMGGLYKAQQLTSIEDVYSYIDTAVVQNILNTVQKNKAYFADRQVINDRNKLTAIVCTVLTAIVFKRVSDNASFSPDFITRAFYNETESSTYDMSMLKSLVYDLFDIRIGTTFTNGEVLSVLSCLEELDLVVKLKHMGKGGNEYDYYIANQSMYNQLVSGIVTYLESVVTERGDAASIRTHFGFIVENVVAIHMYFAAKRAGYTCLFYRDRGNSETKASREIDIIVKKPLFVDSDDCEDAEYFLYEIKATNNPYGAVRRSRWLFVDCPMSNIPLSRKKIIYTGKPYVFNGYEPDFDYSSSKQPRELLASIEKAAIGVELLSAETLLQQLAIEDIWADK